MSRFCLRDHELTVRFKFGDELASVSGAFVYRCDRSGIHHHVAGVHGVERRHDDGCASVAVALRGVRWPVCKCYVPTGVGSTRTLTASFACTPS